MSDTQIKELQRQIAKISGTLAGMTGEKQDVLFAEQALKHLGLKLANPTLRTSTKRSFENQVVKHLVPRFGAMPLDKIGNPDWLLWVTETRESDEGLTRFFNARKALIEIMVAAKDAGQIDRVPKLDNPDEVRNCGRAMDQSEVLAILWRANRPFRFIFYTMWKMGCRPREILRWQWDMIRWNEPGKTWIDIPSRISKTGRTRSIPINPEVSRILHGRFKRGNDSKFVFPSRIDRDNPQLSYQSAWVTACRKARVLDAMVYDLRRTFITRCAAEGKPLVFVAKCLDTSSKMIESVYAKVQVDVMEAIIK